MEEIRIRRIAQMEQYVDAVSAAVERCPDTCLEIPEIAQMWQALVCYLEDGRWLEDFSADERGELPVTLKRGVLSEDGLYDLLQTVAAVQREKT